jgi:hypothetical protein
MADSADELILQMRHLQAQSRAELDARAGRVGLERLKSRAQRLAWDTARELADCEAVISAGEARLERLREGGVTREESLEYVAVKAAVDAARKRQVKARAQHDFALDRMEQAERREYESFHALVRAETHRQLADDPLSNRGP